MATFLKVVCRRGWHVRVGGAAGSAASSAPGGPWRGHAGMQACRGLMIERCPLEILLRHHEHSLESHCTLHTLRSSFKSLSLQGSVSSRTGAIFLEKRICKSGSGLSFLFWHTRPFPRWFFFFPPPFSTPLPHSGPGLVGLFLHSLSMPHAATGVASPNLLSYRILSLCQSCAGFGWKEKTDFSLLISVPSGKIQSGALGYHRRL